MLQLLRPIDLIELHAVQREYRSHLALREFTLVPLVIVIWWWQATHQDGWQARLHLAERIAALQQPWALTLRERFGNALSSLPDWGVSPHEAAALVGGISIGETSLLSEASAERMRQAGLAHVTAVSGPNAAVVAALVVAVMSAVSMPRWTRRIGQLSALWAFVVLVGFEVTVIRAVMLLSVVVVLRIWRRGQGLPGLCLATMLLLGIEPAMAHSVGFALSVVATAALIVFSSAFAEAFAKVMPQGVADALAPTVAALLGCQPVLMMISDQPLSFGQVIANLLVAPVIPAITVVGILACLVAGVFLLPAMWLAAIAMPLTVWVGLVAAFVSERHIGEVPWPLEGTGQALAVTLLAGMAVARIDWSWLRRPAPPTRDRRVRIHLVAWLALSALVVSGVRSTQQVIEAAALPSHAPIVQCDVGQGDALLLRDATAAVLIDTGQHDQALLDCLRREGVTRLSALVLTHSDADHIGAADALIGQVPVDSVLVPDVRDTELAAVADRLQARRVGLSAGMRGSVGQIGWQVLNPTASSAQSIEADGRAVDANGRGLAMLLDVAGLRLLALADLGEAEQERVSRTLKSMGVTAVDVVKVAHHGSGDHSAALYERIPAEVALISVGADNRYGHPSPKLIATLEAAGLRILRTDQCGAIAITPRGDDEPTPQIAVSRRC